MRQLVQSTYVVGGLNSRTEIKGVIFAWFNTKDFYSAPTIKINYERLK